ncbi:aminotransferase class I/II-fold pyridoxal phosphate-dependent enzyme [Modestobacter sp. I12A-02628]|uniref:DegT/DnrJ/EryC1/StrS family aminotransferase n=1 Tax=Goekera deserti TaxID=2497753 RepID=A0A7K3WI73_9ACTN|nr:aminotransferase class I/II-fold pyridoxal phosphate-dependent enzyme [Goekera deserti]NDI48921.1 aminotransferase class I/II-fold pyridoxal phosphate-dependent enzyme [Goekera deserti]NEL55609.1 DegT/DnrJ/EryC1/StrS family aminotransferase [Goekera deserti]
MPVPLVDLGIQRDRIADEVAEGLARVLATTAFIGGPDVTAFEEEFAAFSGRAHCVGLGNGTDALEFALRAAGIGPGDGVALPANTFVATAEAVLRAGATPVLVDVDDEHLLMDPAALAEVAGGCRAVLPVHLFGQMAPMAAIREIADRHQLVVVEDAAQAQGATHHGIGIGGWGAAAGTSFYPGKNLGAYGDAGGITTDDAALARRVRMLAAHGSEVKYQHPVLGFNSRLDTVQAVVLRAKLRRLAEWNAERVAAADRYAALLADVPGVRLPGVAAGNEHVWHLYVVRVAQRDAVLAELNAAGIGAGIHYPVPVHHTGGLADAGYAHADFPVTVRAAGEILSLPLFPGITVAQQERVAEALTAAVAHRG